MPQVFKTLDALLHHDIETKINAVVMEGKNTKDIISLAELTKDLPVSVRFIEEMPFNGTDEHSPGLQWNYIRILEKIKEQYPQIKKFPIRPFPLHTIIIFPVIKET